MKLTVTLNGVKIEKQTPDTWHEVTFRQFLELAKCGGDYVKIISMFTGIDETTIRKAKMFNLDRVIMSLSFLNTIPESKVPDKVLGYDMPKKLEFETIGQFEDCKQKLNEFKDDPSQAYPFICAAYAMKDYDGDAALKLSEQFFEAPCTEVMAIGNFTLMKFIALTMNSQKSSPRVLTLMKKLKLALIGWLARLGFTVRYYIWKRKHRLHENSC
jgi:hypothetical protein